MEADGGAEVAQQVVRVAQVAAGTTLRRAVADLAHDRQVLSVRMRAATKQQHNIVWRSMMLHSTGVFM